MATGRNPPTHRDKHDDGAAANQEAVFNSI
jgi:hypothetical protein